MSVTAVLLLAALLILVIGDIDRLIFEFTNSPHKYQNNMSDIFDLKELVQAVATETGQPIKEVETVLHKGFSVLANKIASDGRAEVHGFGSFHTVQLAPESGVNPKGASYEVGPRIKVEFNAFKTLREEIEATTGIPAIL